MLLQDKNAIIYGAGGNIGGAVARTFAREGARVFLAGRTAAKLEVVAKDIEAAGGRAHTAVVDALDERAVEEHADAVVAQAGSIDVSFNVITRGDVQGTPADWHVGRGLHRPGDQRHHHQLHHRPGRRPPHGGAGLGRDPRPEQRVRARQPDDGRYRAPRTRRSTR